MLRNNFFVALILQLIVLWLQELKALVRIAFSTEMLIKQQHILTRLWTGAFGPPDGHGIFKKRHTFCALRVRNQIAQVAYLETFIEAVRKHH